MDSCRYYYEIIEEIDRDYEKIRNGIPCNSKYLEVIAYPVPQIIARYERIIMVFNNLCAVICNEYETQGHSAFVEKMEAKYNNKENTGYSLSPFEISVLREVAYRYYIYKNSPEQTSDNKYLPHMHKTKYPWNVLGILNPFSKDHPISKPAIFEVEQAYRNISAKQNPAPAAHAEAVPQDAYYEAEAKIKELEAKLKKADDEVAQLKDENVKLEKQRDSAYESVNKQAASIIADAQKKADAIILDAKKKAKSAEAIVKSAEYAKDEIQHITNKNTSHLYKAAVDSSKVNNKIYDQMENAANSYQNEFTSAIEKAIEMLRAEKSEIYERMDKWKDNIYPKKDKMFIDTYLKYFGLWSKNCDSLLVAITNDIYEIKEKNPEFDSNDQITKKFGKFKGQIEAFFAEYESAITTLGYEIFKPKQGERYDSEYHRLSSESDGDDVDEFNGRRIASCKKPGIKKINRLSGKEELLVFAEVEIED